MFIAEPNTDNANGSIDVTNNDMDGTPEVDNNGNETAAFLPDVSNSSFYGAAKAGKITRRIYIKNVYQLVSVEFK